MRFFVSPPFLFFFAYGTYCILPVCLGLSSKLPFSNLYILYVYLSKKKMIVDFCIFFVSSG